MGCLDPKKLDVRTHQKSWRLDDDACGVCVAIARYLSFIFKTLFYQNRAAVVISPLVVSAPVGVAFGIGCVCDTCCSSCCSAPSCTNARVESCQRFLWGGWVGGWWMVGGGGGWEGGERGGGEERGEERRGSSQSCCSMRASKHCRGPQGWLDEVGAHPTTSRNTVHFP